MATLANYRDASLQTTAGAAIAKGQPLAIGATPTAWSMPSGVTPLALGFVALVGLLVYWDRRVLK
jgi:hypothetical protein